jgi:4-diphosphocytidyl-2-C-methyl-D-erythritol kinase
MSVSAVALNAPAKVNLALHVTGRRADGYHLLDSIAVFAEIGDKITIAPAEALTLSVSGPFAQHAPGDASDLAHRAAEAFFAHTGISPGAAIALEKNIPAGAGLGGGSADAAAVLLDLNRYFAAGVAAEELSAIGLALGADVPMCLAGCALRARGVGEDIDRLAGWPALPMVLVWPGRPVSTAEAFRSLARWDNPPLPAPPSSCAPSEVAGYLAHCRNDLEAPALKLCPDIGAVLDALRETHGCLIARMSGSGSACFGLYADAALAEAAAEQVAVARPDWWVCATSAR